MDVTDITDKLKYSGNFDRNFVDSILGKDEPQTPAICGLRVMQLDGSGVGVGEDGRGGEGEAVGNGLSRHTAGGQAADYADFAD